MIKKRSPLLAVFLSILTPGLGHIYVGSGKKGLIIIFFEYTVILLLGILGVLSTFYGILTLAILALFLYLYASINSAKLASKNKEFRLRPYNRWYWYVSLLVTLTVIHNLFFSLRVDILGYETYRIPGRSMEPTLQVGDLITVNTRYSEPAIGDVIVFINPKDGSKPLVKRVVALGGDSIRIKEGIVYRNGVMVDAVSVPIYQRKETFSVIMERKVVPENEMFLLGDWRDNSNDSRFFGTVPKSDIVGIVTYVWFSDDINRIGLKIE